MHYIAIYLKSEEDCLLLYSSVNSCVRLSIAASSRELFQGLRIDKGINHIKWQFFLKDNVRNKQATGIFKTFS